MLVIAALVSVEELNLRLKERAAFLASSLFLAAMLVSAAFGLYPCVLPSNNDPTYSLTVTNASAAQCGLHIGVIWFIPGMALVAQYFVYAYGGFAGKVSVEEEQ